MFRRLRFLSLLMLILLAAVIASPAKRSAKVSCPLCSTDFVCPAPNGSECGSGTCWCGSPDGHSYRCILP
jgi:hypothetical protein